MNSWYGAENYKKKTFVPPPHNKISYDFSSLQSGFCMDFTFCVYYGRDTLDAMKKIMHSNFFLLLFINVLKLHC
jgi:hypothetical protein